MRRDIIFLGLILCIGCEDDPTAPAMPDLNGEWTYSATNLRAPGNRGDVTCNVSNLTLSITQTGTSLSGTYSGGTVTCSNGLSYPFPGEASRDLTGGIPRRPRREASDHRGTRQLRHTDSSPRTGS